MDLAFTLAGLAAVLGIAVLSNWQAGREWNGLRPRIIPWKFVLILSGFLAIVLIVHVVNLLGVETGPDQSPFSRIGR
ncbi:MAG: hypothetical protein AAGJ29_05635 [Pseudomonadota bacterium]